MIKFKIRRRNLYLLVAAIAMVAVAIPTAGWAGHGFTDVPDSNTFHADIDWLADAGVTKGCNPPANTEFCPKDNVKRETMAAFLRRLAENQVVDAGMLEGMSAEEVMSDGTGDSYIIGNTQAITGVGTVETVPVTVPADGYILVNATAAFTAIGTSNTLIWLQLDNGTCSNTPAMVSAGGFGYATGTPAISGSFSQTFAVTAGAHTLTLCGNAYIGDLTQEVLAAGVQTLWFQSGQLTTNLAGADGAAIPGTSG